MSEIWQIGRVGPKGKLSHAFNIRRTDDGGIKLSKAQGLTEAERHDLFAHFGRVHQARTGGYRDGEHWEGWKKVEPGTEQHFLKAVWSLPGLFKVMG